MTGENIVFLLGEDKFSIANILSYRFYWFFSIASICDYKFLNSISIYILSALYEILSFNLSFNTFSVDLRLWSINPCISVTFRPIISWASHVAFNFTFSYISSAVFYIDNLRFGNNEISDILPKIMYVIFDV